MALPTIARMTLCRAFVSMLVVSSHAGHKLLTVRELAGLNLSCKLSRLNTSQTRCKTTFVNDLYVAILSDPIRKSQVSGILIG